MFIEFIVIFILLIISGYFGYKLYTKKSKTEDGIVENKGELEKIEKKYLFQIKELEAKIISQKNTNTDNQLVLSELKLELKEKMAEEEKEMRQRILKLQENVDKKEEILAEKLEKIENEREYLSKLKEELKNIKEELLSKRQEVEKKESELENTLKEKLEQIANLSQKEAKEQLYTKAKEEMGQELIEYQHKILEETEENSNIKAREIVAMAIQRCSSEVANEFTVTTIKLNSEDDKGKLIGKQGRNIQWLEKTLGVELIIDDTPEVVTISGFSSIRRHIAKKTIEKLLADNRINPSFIEEMHEKAKSEIAEEIAVAGEWAVSELGIYDFPAKLTRIIGRLKFRTSYGQNMLKHSVEMAKLAGLLADELNANFPSLANPIDKTIAIKGALLHDIGKAVDEEFQPKGDHIQLGEKICDMFNLDWRIKKCISSHHNEQYNDPEKGFCVEAVIVDACDNISGSRPGARKESAEAYFQRMEAMEKVAESVPGVDKSWIMRGSKEMWVFFDPEKISLSQMNKATRNIAKEVAMSVKSPVKIKVIGFYDKRIVEFAG